jgi:hypothetical protein
MKNKYKLTNLTISAEFRNQDFWLFKSDFLSALAYWLMSQSPYDVPDITDAINAYSEKIDNKFESESIPYKFAYDEVEKMANGDLFESMPEIEIFSHPKVSSGPGYSNRHERPHPDYGFIDLSALARNVFYMILRQQIIDLDEMG